MKIVLLALSIGLMGVPLMAAGVESAIAGLEKQWVDAVVKGDRAVLSKLVSDDVSYTHSTVKIENKQQFLDAITANPPVSIDFKNVETRVYGDAAVVTHESFFKQKNGTVAHIYVTHVWAKTKSGWQMVSRQATRYPEK